MKSKDTTIRISFDTKKRLDRLGTFNEKNYNQVVMKLLDMIEAKEKWKPTSKNGNSSNIGSVKHEWNK